MSRDVARSGPRWVLPWFLGATGLALIAVIYALLSQYSWFVVGTVVVLTTLIGAVTGLVMRDSHDRLVSIGHSLTEAAKRLGHALWY